jgi:hypothetical protein
MSKRISEDGLAVLVAIVQGSDGSLLKNVGFGTCTRVGAGNYSILTPSNFTLITNELFITAYLRGQTLRAAIQTLVTATAINVTTCNDAGALADSDWGIKIERI